MKKNFSRALSLLLVLVMVLGAMPVALATEPGDEGGEPTPIVVPTTVEVTASPANPKVGQTVTFTVNVPNGFTASGISWIGATGTGTSATAVCSAEGSLAASVTLTLTSTTDETATGTATGSKSVTVAAADQVATAIAITGSASMTVGETQTLAIAKSPDNSVLPAAAVWSSANTAVAAVNASTGVVTAKKAGTAKITVTCGTLKDDFTITVTNDVVKLNVLTSSLTLSPKQTGKIEYRVSGATAEQVSVTMTTGNRNFATVSSSTGVVTAVAAGNTYITVKAALTRSAPSGLSFEGGKTSVEVTVPVYVDDLYYISCPNQSAVAGSRITLSPVLYDGSGNRVTNATFTYSSNNCTVSNNNNQIFYVSSNAAGSASVTFTANNVDNDGRAVTKTVYLGFYRTNSLKVSVRDNISSFRFYDQGIFQSAIGGSQNYTNLNSLSMEDLIGYAMPIGVYSDVDFYSFGISGSNGGELLEPTSGSSLSWTGSTRYVDRNNMSTVGFQQKSGTNKVSNFTVYAMSGNSTDSVTVGMLTLEINAGAASGGIEYSTNYNTPVTFKVADFQSYWNAHKNDYYNYGTSNNGYNTYDCGCHGITRCTTPTCRFYTGYTSSNNGYYGNETLSYVTFGISNTVPAYGTVYTTSAKTTKATAGMKFYVSTTNYNSSYSTYNYALSSVTYVPSATYTATYTVDIPFTAYGTNGTSVTGYVSIKLNDKGNTIGARGTTLDDSVAASIAANYYAAKGTNMAYVVFTLPSAQQATLFRSIPKVDGYSRVTEATRVQSGDKFYYNTTGSSYTYSSTYNQYVNNNTVNCGCNNLYYCTNSWCKFYDGTNSTIDCGCHNQYYCTNTYCMYYDGTSYNTNSTIDCGCHNQYYCTNTYCVYYDGTSYNTTTNTTYSSNQMKLTDVGIVPAAGFEGKLTLSYTAYNAGGANPYTGYITFDVETKTASAVFSDVKGSYSWAADSADFLYYEGTAQGSGGKYNPSANITRGDFMLMLYRAFLAEDYDTTAVTSNFSDVTEGTSSYSKETYKAVGIAKQLGIAQGTNGKFNPKSNITREEAMVLIYRTLDEVNRNLRYTSSTKASSFSDYSKISSWATTAISDLVSHGVIQGNNNKVNPKSNITRAEMACILHRVITY